MQVKVDKKVWTQITDQDAKLHVKVPGFTKVFYIESNDNPNELYPNPTEADPIYLLVTPNHAAGYVNLDYQNGGNGPLWMYSTNSPLYIIVD